MSIGICIPFIGNFGAKGFYNSQEVGLAKELSKHDNVIIFKLVCNIDTVKTEEINDRCSINYIPSKNIGINGLIYDFSIINPQKISKLVCFSDTQIIVKRLYRYCIKNNIEFIPYIGVLQSNSHNKYIKKIMKIFAETNVKIYRQCNKVMAKTPNVVTQLNDKGITNVLLSPVGLDFDLMQSDFEKYDVVSLKRKLGYEKNDKIILFIGRLEQLKNPLFAIEILKNLLLKDNSYKMVIIGSGSLKGNIINEINNGLEDKIQFIEKINNSEIWKYYRISNCFVNLNKDEIFGMAILESMYYKCPVIAVKAPGPNYIIDNQNVGVLVDNLDKEIISEVILDKDQKLEYIKERSNEYIRQQFSWSICAKNILM